MIGNVFLILGILVWLLVLDLRLCLISAAVFPVLLVLSAYFSKLLKIAYREARSRLSALNSFLAENFLGMRVVHLFNQQEKHLARFSRINEWYTEAQIASIHVYALFHPAITLASGIAIGLLIWYGGEDTRQGRLPLGVWVAYFAYVSALFQPLREMADKWNVFLSGMASVERIFSILSWPVEISEAELTQAGPVVAFRGDIRFENVWFAYEEGRWIFKDLSLDIPAGTQLGVVGHTGAGKTTLISLLLRFYDPQKGRILLDGKDIREIDRRVLRSAIGVVQQDVFLFSGSVQDNITFWGPPPANGSIKELQERGSNLSMGERQMLAFERALVRNPSVWVLDEATANMDFQAETKLHQALEASARDKTTILIAHRLATVRSAHRIIVLHRGSMVESGSHRELLEKNGLYARLYRYQQIRLPQAPPSQNV